MYEVSFRLPTGETLKVSREDARALARRLWDVASEPGAAPLAVAISDTLAGPVALLRPIELTERERAALQRVLGERSDGSDG